jgi:hypothetical protein
MKQIKLLIGLALALVLCISPVAAVSGDDFEIVIDDSGDIPTYKYCNPNYKKHPDCPTSPGEKYFLISCRGTDWLKSFVTFKPANIPDAPTMMVDTNSKVNIYLPYYSVDAWEIKYYSNFRKMSPPYDKYLKNSGVLNMRDTFNPGYWGGGELRLELSSDQYLWGYSTEFNLWSFEFTYHDWYIPDVD